MNPHVFRGTLGLFTPKGFEGSVPATGNARQRRRVARQWQACGFEIRVWAAGFPTGGRWLRWKEAKA